MPPAESTPQPSAVSTFISTANTKSPREALALEIVHNLRYQHRWTDLKLHSIPIQQSTSTLTPPRTQSPSESQSPTTRSKSPARDDTIYLLSGLPPRNMYIHPDLQKRILRQSISENRIERQREWVLPQSIGEKWTLKRFCQIFDELPEREPVQIRADEAETVEVDAKAVSDGGQQGTAAGSTNGANGAVHSPGSAGFEWKDSKRVVLGMLAHNGMGGDGTVAYYIMQEGEVKPRQHG